MEYSALISDIMGCITDNTITGYFHHESQYIGVTGFSELEIFADVFAVIYQGDESSVHFLKTELYEIYNAFQNMIKEKTW